MSNIFRVRIPHVERPRRIADSLKPFTNCNNARKDAVLNSYNKVKALHPVFGSHERRVPRMAWRAFARLSRVLVVRIRLLESLLWCASPAEAHP